MQDFKDTLYTLNLWMATAFLWLFRLFCLSFYFGKKGMSDAVLNKQLAPSLIFAGKLSGTNGCRSACISKFSMTEFYILIIPDRLG